MTTEILKFMVESAADFELSKVEPNSYNIRYMFKNCVIGLGKIETIESSRYYPLLLTRACEGLIKEKVYDFDMFVDISGGWNIRLLDIETGVPHDHVTGSTPDEAKEAAITAVMKEMIG